jgi:hypothetical protein
VAVPPRSPAALATAIAALLRDPAHHAAVATAALQAATQFRTAPVAAAMLQVYAAALRSRET